MDDIKFSALLPMKAHSERLVNKNIKDFNGRPLYFCILKTLQESKYIDEILIDTDSDYILNNTPSEYDKVKLVKRVKHLEGDFAPFLDLIEYDMNLAKNNHFIQTHSTNPLITTKTIDSAIEYYLNNLKELDSLFGATKVRSRLYDKMGKPINHKLADRLLRTQDLPEIWEENSTMYIFSKESFIAGGRHRLGKKYRPFEIPALEAVDIDEESDFIMAQSLEKIFKRNQ